MKKTCDHNRISTVGGADFCSKCLTTIPALKKNTPKKRSKYNNKISYEDGIKFDSDLELRYYRKLKIQRDNGDIAYFLLQTPFHLPGSIKYICDFMVVGNDGSIRYIDVKGVETRVFINKKKQVEALYAPVKIEVIKNV